MEDVYDLLEKMKEFPKYSQVPLENVMTLCASRQKFIVMKLTGWLQGRDRDVMRRRSGF